MRYHRPPQPTQFLADDSLGVSLRHLEPQLPEVMLAHLVQEKVKSGFYNNASEVVRDALRRAFCQPSGLNLDEDTPELAALIRDGLSSRHTPHRKGDVRERCPLRRTLAGRPQPIDGRTVKRVSVK